jgi:hypothetical protein
MTQTMNNHPDLLRRFVSILYTFDVIVRNQQIRIQSNDLELALRIRRFCMQRFNETNPTVLVWKLPLMCPRK